ncbi:SNF2 family N-terminal domain-containing protein [Stachybotrys elegans]|uniref:SNF2 family N-terminal domain-containing protein n=1 Tax=Stachybotrys elegans TaxID=80388 RepID=A0A8K0T5C0_9HYPO|nr:SNF2 family N-terminal domain-containing protein [Stachybotrys elegans]
MNERPAVDSANSSRPKHRLGEAGNDIAAGLPATQSQSIKRPRTDRLATEYPIDGYGGSKSQYIADDGDICFGMLINIAIQFDLPRHIPSLTFDDSGVDEDIYVRLHLLMKDDRCDIQSNGISIASMNKRTHLSLKSLSEMPLRFIGLLGRKDMEDELRVASKAPSLNPMQRKGSMAILVLGPESVAESVAQELSCRHLFLQHPYPMVNMLPYNNPQYLDIIGTISTNESIVPLISSNASQAATPQTGQQEADNITDLVSLLDNLPNFGYSPEVQIDDRLKTPLLKHQREAANFIIQRETGGSEMQGSLWHVLPQSEAHSFWYKHMITGSKRSTPDDVPGGIFADGMGLGKTLTMIAAVVASLSRASEFATFHSKATEVLSWLVRVQSTLVIVPSALLMDVWIDEIKKHLEPGALVIYKYHGPNRRLSTGQALPYHIVLSTYGTVAADFSRGGGVLNEFHWHRLILDEAHYIRNSATKQFKAVANIQALIRWCVTGTVIQNSVDDLGSLVRFLRIPELDDIKTFRKHIAGKCKMVRGVSKPNYGNLKKLLGSICFGRNTSSILTNLGVSFIECRPSFSDSERTTYNGLAIAYGNSIKASINTAFQKQADIRVLTAVLRLREFCNLGVTMPGDPDCVDNLAPEEAVSILEQDGHQYICANCRMPSWTSDDRAYGNEQQQMVVTRRRKCQLCAEQRLAANDEESTSTGDSSSMDVLSQETRPDLQSHPEEAMNWEPTPPSVYPSKIKALLKDVKEHYSESKCIVFSFWTRSLDLIGNVFNAEGIVFGRIDGQIHPSQRKQVLSRFCGDASIRVLLMTIGTGSVGLNDLSVASRVHILEPQWNPSTESQAIGRVFRLGQEKRICVIRYIMEKSIEESIETRQIVKIQLASRSGLQNSHGGDSKRNKKLEYLRSLADIIESTATRRQGGQGN